MLHMRWVRRARYLLLALVAMLALAGCSVHDAESKMRFGMPSGVTKQAERIRTLWTWSSVTALIIGVMVWGLIFWACIRYRKKSDELPVQLKYNLAIEWTYTILPFFVIFGLFFFTVRTENYVDKLSKNPDVLVKVDAFKWNWQFEYLQNHGTELTYSGTQQAPSTVGSSDEVPIIVIPRGETVQFVEHSEDVIHAFWVPEFLFKRDVIPNGSLSSTRDNRFEITATSDGSYVGRCAELCGTYHSEMNFEVRVVEPDVYQNYVDALIKIGPDDPARQSKALAAVGQEPYATTTHPFNTNRQSKSAS